MLLRHAPPPLQTVAPVHVPRSAWPDSTFEHVPFGWPVLASEHAVQVKVQALPQHTPSTQKPEVHSVARVQAAPVAS